MPTIDNTAVLELEDIRMYEVTQLADGKLGHDAVEKRTPISWNNRMADAVISIGCSVICRDGLV